MILVVVLSTIGFIVALYTYLVEQKVKSTPDYQPACDISDRISCSRVMKSPYSNLLFFSNAFLGIAYYALVFILALFNAKKLLLIASIGSCFYTLFLAYILYFKIKSFCILCTSTYLINFALLIAIISSL